jgi:hypothetical protein
LVLILNFGISWANAYVCGRSWVETKVIGGFPRLLLWCGAIQSAIGFSSVIGFFLGWIAYTMGHIPPETLKQAASLWYVTIIFPALGTGLIITIESWRAAFRERSLTSMGSAAWNTFAELHNAYEAMEGIGDAFKDVGDLFGGLFDGDDDDAKAKLAMVAILLVVIALASGCLLTAILIKKYAATEPLPHRAIA